MDYVGEQPLKWLVLTQSLAAASGSSAPFTPATATANPANWDATANSGAGGYRIDTGTTLTVVEATGHDSYATGAWVLCRPRGCMNVGVLWEPIPYFRASASRSGGHAGLQ